MTQLAEVLNHLEGCINIDEGNGENLSQQQLLISGPNCCTFDAHVLLLYRSLVWTLSTEVMDAAK
jgi:hypothetical protein